MDSSQIATRQSDQLVLAEGSQIPQGSPIYFKEHTVNDADKQYDVMILIKPKENGNDPPGTTASIATTVNQTPVQSKSNRPPQHPQVQLRKTL